MPQRRCAIKDLRKNRANHMRNLDRKTDLKKTIKSYTTIVAGNAKDAAEQLKRVYKKLDKAVKTNVMSKNTASRRKSRLSKLLNASTAK